MNFVVKYGFGDNMIDVTQVLLNSVGDLRVHNIVHIPKDDNKRCSYFTDPIVGTVKSVFIVNILTNQQWTVDTSVEAFIDIENSKVYVDEETPDEVLSLFPYYKLLNLHKQLKLDHGSLTDEFPEQLMAVTFINKQCKVLEIGGNIGRNSIVIAKLLENSSNLVTLETDPSIAKQLAHNRDINNLQFHIENSALSERKLIQKGWDTICSDVLLPGYIEVNTIRLPELMNKYNIEFDTLVLDCEGAFYYILQDMPQLLHNINLIIMENDYHEIAPKRYVDNVLAENKFRPVYRLAGGWGPCYNCFFEVWKKL